MRSNGAGSRRTEGYSAVELIIVAMVAAIMLSLAVVGIKLSVAREQIDGWARSMTYELAAARQAAITRRQWVRVLVTSGQFTVSAYSSPSSGCPTAAAATLRVATLPSDITMANTCPSSICWFNHRGVPMDGSSSCATDATARTVTLTSASSGRTFTIRIEAGTGRPSYSEP